MTRWLAVLAAVSILAQAASAADEYRVEKFDDGPPADVLSAQVVAKLSPTGFKLIGPDAKAHREIWLAKELTVRPDFEPSLSILYPLQSGSLVGAMRLPFKGSDFRGQEIPAGTYTLRYANQPEDGNHVGTFETRDFLLMLPAASDTDPKTLEGTDFFATSAESAGSTHPAIIPILKPEEAAAPAVRHLEQMEWWSLRLAGTDAKGANQLVEMVIAGKAAE
jgi:hypothetical protein